MSGFSDLRLTGKDGDGGALNRGLISTSPRSDLRRVVKPEVRETRVEPSLVTPIYGNRSAVLQPNEKQHERYSQGSRCLGVVEVPGDKP
jgi:hypothetical protein